MSKAQLKKELAAMSHEQLEQIILDAYDARKDTKEYFEFFLNPDAEKLRDKYFEAFAKELRRVKWGMSKARVSVFKKGIKEYESFGVAPADTLALMSMTLQLIGLTAMAVKLTDTQIRYCENLIIQMLNFGDKYLIADKATEDVGKILARDDMPRWLLGRLKIAAESR